MTDLAELESLDVEDPDLGSVHSPKCVGQCVCYLATCVWDSALLVWCARLCLGVFCNVERAANAIHRNITEVYGPDPARHSGPLNVGSHGQSARLLLVVVSEVGGPSVCDGAVECCDVVGVVGGRGPRVDGSCSSHGLFSVRE